VSFVINVSGDDHSLQGDRINQRENQSTHLPINLANIKYRAVSYRDQVWAALERLNIPRHAVNAEGVETGYRSAERAGATPEEAAIVLASLLPPMYREVANPFAINGWLRNGAVSRADPSVRNALIQIGWGRFLR
jgi:hypothetical protein